MKTRNPDLPHSAPGSLRTSDIVAAYTLLRIIVGVNYFNHGFTRLGNIPGFVSGMVERFQDTFLPTFLVQINAFIVSPVELIVGILITIGLFTRSALIATLLLMVMLMYGATLIQSWDTAASQLIYDLILAILLAGLGYNTVSVDRWLQKRGQTPAQAVQNSGQNLMRVARRILLRKPRHRNYRA